MRQRVEFIVSLTVVGLAIFLVVGFVRSGLAPWDHPLIPTAVRPGFTLPTIPGLDDRLAGTTLVLAVRKGCEYCEASVPFYAELAQLQREGRLRARLLAVMPDSQAAAEGFLSAHNLDIPVSAGVPMARMHVIGTPTLIWVNARRRVLRVWVGELTTLGQQRLLSVLARDPGMNASAPAGAEGR